MEFEIKIDKTVKVPRAVIYTDEITDEVDALIKFINANPSAVITGFAGGKAVILNEDEIYRIYAASGSVYAETENDEYVLRMRLYEIEERMDAKKFIRISNSEIVNLKRVKELDLSFAGTIQILLTNGKATYVSRRYVRKIKDVLGI